MLQVLSLIPSPHQKKGQNKKAERYVPELKEAPDLCVMISGSSVEE